MQSIIIHRIATTAVMPLVAASGFAGYSYYRDPGQYQQNQYPQMICTNLVGDLAYTNGNQYYHNQSDVVSLQRFLVARGYLNGNVSGVYDQATFIAVERFQADNGIPVTGVADAQTRSLIQQMSCGGQGGYQNTNGQLSVQGIDAPRSLNVGQSGTWSVHVQGWTNYQGGGALHYSVVWGDENDGVRTAAAYYPSTSVNSSGSFTHVYTRAGTFTPVFTVTDDYGHSTQVSATTYVTGTTYGNGGSTGGSNSSYCSTYSGRYDRNCYQNNGGYTGGSYGGGYQGNTSTGCSTYYDRNCYVNNQYTGPGGTNTYNGPGDTCYYSNGQWIGNCGNSSFGGSTSYNDSYYNRSTSGSGTSGYVNPLGGPNGADYSCYYDRACLAQMQGGSY